MILTNDIFNLGKSSNNGWNGKQMELWQKWEVENCHFFKLIASIKDAKPSYKHEEKNLL